MDPIFCANCSVLFTPKNKNQSYCSRHECQRARKAAWQRLKITTDPDYKAGQKLSRQKWAQNNPYYWINYRARNPKKTERNRILQTLRNQRRKKRKHEDDKLIAKMDARKPLDFQLMGRFWLVPVIAKMDARKVIIHTISKGYQ